VDLEIAQLDLRYQELRTRSADRERRLVGSLDAAGQQTPIVVVRDGESAVVVDGYKRVRALRRLGRDVVRATTWDLGELDALLLERVLRASDTTSALEEGWFLKELVTRFGLSRDELARRFDRTTSWGSRRRGRAHRALPPPRHELGDVEQIVRRQLGRDQAVVHRADHRAEPFVDEPHRAGRHGRCPGSRRAVDRPFPRSGSSPA